MVSLNLKAKPLLPGPAGPYIVVALQECGRMNLILRGIGGSSVDLYKGRRRQLNVSQKLEDFVTALKLLTNGLVDILLANALGRKGHSQPHSAKDGSSPCR